MQRVSTRETERSRSIQGHDYPILGGSLFVNENDSDLPTMLWTYRVQCFFLVLSIINILGQIIVAH